MVFYGFTDLYNIQHGGCFHVQKNLFQLKYAEHSQDLENVSYQELEMRQL